MEPRLSKLVTELLGIAIVVTIAFSIARWFGHTGRFPTDAIKLLAIGATWIVPVTECSIGSQ